MEIWRQEQAFEQLKHKLYTATVLVLPNLHHPFEIYMDAFDYALGTVIAQSSHPFSFHSKNFNDIVRSYSTHEKEMHAIVKSLNKWRHYVLGKEMIILTEHKPLQFTLS